MRTTSWFVIYKTDSQFVSVTASWACFFFNLHFSFTQLNCTSQRDASVKIFEPQVSAIMGAYAERVIKVSGGYCATL